MNGPVTDCHAHMADSRVWRMRHAVLSESRAHGLAGILANAARRSEWDQVLELAAEKDVQAAIGIHPFWPDEWDEGAKAGMLKLLENGAPISAIGEIGLDFWNGRENRRQQERAFVEQLEIAVSRRLPACIHNRKSWDEFFSIIGHMGISTLCGYCHNFTGSRETAKRVLDLGLHISFCSPVTYENADRLRDLSRYVPEDKILTETDFPDLPMRRFKGAFSMPWHAGLVAETLAEARGMAPHALAERIAENFHALFPPISAPPVSPAVRPR